MNIKYVVELAVSGSVLSVGSKVAVGGVGSKHVGFAPVVSRDRVGVVLRVAGSVAVRVHKLVALRGKIQVGGCVYVPASPVAYDDEAVVGTVPVKVVVPLRQVVGNDVVVNGASPVSVVGVRRKQTVPGVVAVNGAGTPRKLGKGRNTSFGVVSGV